MRALKTIVATAVIVFALTTAAMAGVQHFTKQSGQADDAQARQAQPTYTVNLTAAQLKDLMGANDNGATKAATHAQRQRHQDKARERDTHRATAGDANSGTRTWSTQGSRNNGSGSNSSRCYDDDRDCDWGGSSSGQHHSGDGDHHSGGGNGDCW